MVDIQKQIEHWRANALEDWQVARDLIDDGHFRHGLFFVQLSLEKALKAHVIRTTQDLAPRIHNLVRLVQIAALDIRPEYLDVLADMNAFNLEGRYPDVDLPLPTKEETQNYLARSEEVFQWLMSQLS